MINLLFSQKELFINAWRNKISDHQNSLNLEEDFALSNDDLNMLVNCFSEDIEFQTSQKTFLTLKNMIEKSSEDSSFLFKTELMNITFKETAREILTQNNLVSTEEKKRIMGAIGQIVDQIDLRLSLEYEKMVSMGLKKVKENERLSTKSAMLTTLQHEIRQPLSYIFNSAEMLLSGEFDDQTDHILNNILNQSKEIEQLLSRLDKTSKLPFREYSDNIQIVDFLEEQGDS